MYLLSFYLFTRGTYRDIIAAAGPVDGKREATRRVSIVAADAEAAFALPLSLSSPPKSAHTRPHASERADAPVLPVRESLFDLM